MLKDWKSCTACGLSERRTSVVLGRGVGGGLVIVGEAPGRREDEEGKPFVGPSGEMLLRLLQDAGIDPKSVYITNVVACRPTDSEGRNRAPTEEEIEACAPRLSFEWRLADPTVLLLLGSTAVQTLTNVRSSMSKVAGRLLDATIDVGGVRGTVPAFACWHPSFLLRVDAKRQATGYYGRAVKVFRLAKALLDALLLFRRKRKEVRSAEGAWAGEPEELGGFPHAVLASLAKVDFPDASLLHRREELLGALLRGEPLPETEEKKVRTEVRRALARDSVLRFRMPEECDSCHRHFQRECPAYRAVYHWLITTRSVVGFK